MPAFPGYTLETELFRSPVGDVWVARPDGARSSDRVVIRACVSHDALSGPDGRDTRIERFFQSCGRQARVAKLASVGKGGIGHVAPVRAFEATAEGGFAVEDHYGMTAAQLASARPRMSGHRLFELVRGVLDGLEAIAAADRGRAHGDLQPSHVLIDDSVPMADRNAEGRWRIGLTGLAPAAVVDADGDRARHEDLRALGRLIHELVEHRAFRELSGFPIRDESGAWGALGEKGSGWLRLANMLLDPGAKPGQIRLAEVSEEVDALSESAKKTGKVVWIAASGVMAAVVVVAGVGAFLLTREEKVPEAAFDRTKFEVWCAAYSDPSGGLSWFGELVRDREDLAALAARDPSLRGAVVEPFEATQRGVLVSPRQALMSETGDRGAPNSGSAEVLFDWLLVNHPEFVETTSELGGVVDANAALIAQLWPRFVLGEEESIAGEEAATDWSTLVEVRSIAASWRDNGWDAPAAWLETVLAEVTPDEPGADGRTDFLSELRDVIGARDAARAFETEWRAALARAEAIEQLGTGFEVGGESVEADPVLSNATAIAKAHVARSLNGAPSGGDTIESMRRPLTEVNTALRKLEDYRDAADGLSSLDRQWFSTRSDLVATLRDRAHGDDDAISGLTLDDVDAWVAEASLDRYKRLDPADDPRLGEGWMGAVAELAEIDGRRDEVIANAAPAWEAKQAELGRSFGDEWSTVRARVQAFDADAVPWARRNEAALASGTVEVAAEVEAFRRFWSPFITELLVKWEDVLGDLVDGEIDDGPDGGAAVSAARIVPNAELSIQPLVRARASHIGELLSASWPQAADERTRTAAASRVNRSVKEIDAYLASVQSTLAEAADVTIQATPSAFDAAELDRARSLVIDAAAGRVIENAGWSASDGGYRDGDAALGSVSAETRAWVERVTEAVSGFAQAERLFELAALPDEAVDASGATLRGIANEWLDDPLFVGGPGEALWRAMGAVGPDLRRLVTLEAVSIDDTFVSIAADDGEQVSSRRHAYNLLGRGGVWPGEVDALRADASAFDALRSSLVGLSADRAAVVSAWLDALGFDRWERAYDSASSNDSAREVLSLRARYGISIDQLSGRARFAAVVSGLDALDVDLDDGPVREAIRAALPEIRSATSGAGSAGEAWLGRLEELLVQDDEGEAFDPAKTGPGAHGWRVVGEWDARNARDVTYRSPDGRATITFAIVLKGSVPEEMRWAFDEDMFIATDEVSVDVFNAMLHAAGTGRPAFVDEGDESWPGPRAWRWDESASRFVVNAQDGSPRWLRSDPNYESLVPRYPPELMETFDQWQPTLDHPMTRVPLTAFGEVFQAVGVRLPTPEEWVAVYHAIAQASPSAGVTANLRDQTWSAFESWLKQYPDLVLEANPALQNQSREVWAALDGAIPYDKDDRFPIGDDSAHAWDDQMLWFEPVSRDRSGLVVHHMIGNAAEWVASSNAAGRPQYGVIGGSALSPPGLPIDESFEMRRTPFGYRRINVGYSDVGARPVFTAQIRRSVGDRLAELRETAPLTASN